MKVIRRIKLYTLLYALISLVIGVFLIINPVKTSSTLIVMVGAVIIGSGLLRLIKYLKSPAAGRGTLMSAVIVMLIGFVICVNAPGLVNMLSKIISIIVIISGINSLDHAVQLYHNKVPKSILNVIFAIMILVAGIVTLFIPFGAVAPVIVVLGVIMIVNGLVEIFHLFRMKKIDETNFQQTEFFRGTPLESDIIDIEINDKK